MRFPWSLVGVGLSACLALVHCVGDEPSTTPGGATDGGSSDAPITSDDGQPPSGTAQLTLAKAQQWVAQNGNASVNFSIARGTATGALVVHATGLPAGVTAADVNVAAGASSGTLALAAAGTAVIGASSTASIALQSGGQALDQKMLNVGVSGAPGSLDTTFGTAGIETFPLSIEGATQPVLGARIALDTSGLNAGKIVVGATVKVSATDFYYAVARLNADGSLDTGFGLPNGGVRFGYQIFQLGATTSGGEMLLRSIAIDSAGRILLLGRHDLGQTLLELARLTTTGDIDGSFTTYSANPFSAYSGDPYAVVVGPSDQPIVLTEWNTSLTVTGSFLMGFQNNGALVTGPSLLQVPGRDSTYLSAMQRDSTGRLVTGGFICNGGGGNPITACQALVVAATSGFAFDTTFGDVGVDGGKTGYAIVQADLDGGSSEVTALTLDPTTHDVISSGLDQDPTLALIDRRKTDGTLVTSFGTGGQLALNAIAGSSFQQATAALLDANGNLVVVGARETPSEIFRTRLNAATGAIDTSYADTGVGTSPLGANGSPDAVLLPDGRLVIAAEVDGSPTQLAVYRYWP